MLMFQDKKVGENSTEVLNLFKNILLFEYYLDINRYYLDKI